MVTTDGILREVRLRRAHQTLIDSQASDVTVAWIAYRWGLTNLGPFAAAHASHYSEAHRQPCTGVQLPAQDAIWPESRVFRLADLRSSRYRRSRA